MVVLLACSFSFFVRLLSLTVALPGTNLRVARSPAQPRAGLEAHKAYSQFRYIYEMLNLHQLLNDGWQANVLFGPSLSAS